MNILGCLKKIKNYIQILVIKEFSFMSKVLITEQREQAGSDSYNRIEYQVHWIVCYIIGIDCQVKCNTIREKIFEAPRRESGN